MLKLSILKKYLTRVTFHVTFVVMIVSLRHKGLKLYYEQGNASRLQPHHVSKIRLILTRLDAAKTPGELNVPGYSLHKLTGELKEFWAVKVDKNYRLIFRFIGEDTHDVDYVDYH
jgi:proteic killer suppression protein